MQKSDTRGSGIFLTVPAPLDITPSDLNVGSLVCVNYVDINIMANICVAVDDYHLEAPPILR